MHHVQTVNKPPDHLALTHERQPSATTAGADLLLLGGLCHGSICIQYGSADHLLSPQASLLVISEQHRKGQHHLPTISMVLMVGWDVVLPRKCSDRFWVVQPFLEKLTQGKPSDPHGGYNRAISVVAIESEG